MKLRWVLALAVAFLFQLGLGSARAQFVFNFDENGNGMISISGGAFMPLNGSLMPDPSNGGALALTYLLPATATPVGNGDVRIFEPAATSAILSDVLRFTDANGSLTGLTADRMIYYSD